MVVFPNAKINLGLNVVRKRPDGFHDIESVMVPIPLCDVLEAVVYPTIPAGEVVYTRSGLPIDGDPEQDLCMRGHKLLCTVRTLPGLRMHLHKVVPMGAGLGGGSSDGAHALMLLDNMLGLALGAERVHAMAAELGSDVPFFQKGGPCIATGRGEMLEPIDLDLRGLWLHLVQPPIHIATAEVYKRCTPTGTLMEFGKTLRDHPVERWQDRIVNTMEEVVFKAHPEIAAIKHRLLTSGAILASMSGSGSSVFGLFRNEPPAVAWPATYSHWNLRLGDQKGSLESVSRNSITS